jgi:hypothetical protein
MESTFIANPTVNTFYVFDDGNAFISKRDADNYSNQTNQKFDVIEREEIKPKKEKK